MGRKAVPRQHEVQVHQQHQGKQGLDGVQDFGDVARSPFPRKRPATNQPTGQRDQRGADRRARESTRRRAEDQQARQRPTNPADPFERDKPRHQPKPLSALQNPVAQPDQSDRRQRQRQEDHGPRVVDVQQRHQQRRGEKSGQHDRAAGQQAEGDELTTILLRILRDLESDHGLQTHRRHRPDDQDGSERPELPKRRRDKQTGRDHRHQVARDVRTREGGGHVKRIHPSPG